MHKVCFACKIAPRINLLHALNQLSDHLQTCFLELKYFIYPAAVSSNEENESKKFAQYEHS